MQDQHVFEPQTRGSLRTWSICPMMLSISDLAAVDASVAAVVA
jgi:hypothetical protein